MTAGFSDRRKDFGPTQAAGFGVKERDETQLRCLLNADSLHTDFRWVCPS
jgi:hypothetical protein